MQRSSGGTRAWAMALGAVSMSALLVVGCSKSDSKFNTVGNAINTSSDKASQASAAGGGSAETRKPAPSGPKVGEQADDARDVIYTGSMRVRVGDAVKAADEARSLAEDAGGYLARQDSQLDGDRQVSLTLRVPADEFDATMTKVARLGKVQGRKVDSQDVTDQVVDVEGRLDNARTSAERLRELLAKAENIQNIVAIEDRLTQRESEIESLAGSLEVLKDQVKLATVRVTLTEKDEAAVTKDLPGPLEALRSGGVAFVNVLLFLLVAIAYGLPFLVTAALIWLLFRRWRKAHPKAVRPAPAGYRPPPPDPVPAAGPAAFAPPAPPASAPSEDA